MKKLILLPLVLIIATGAYALVENLFPDNTALPRIPTGPGTIGYALTKWFGESLDQDLPINTLNLGWVSSTGYVSTDGANCPGDAVWRGVDSTGKVICRAPLLAIGEIYEGTMKVTRNGSVVLDTNLFEGDVVETDSSQTGTILFTDDASIARLDTNTKVILERGTNTDGTPIAQLILDNGLIWGRVLTGTGVNFGGGGYVVGVRGTSIALSGTANQFQVTLVDSQLSDNKIRKSQVDGTSLYEKTLSTYSTLNYSSGAPYLTTVPSVPRASLYDTPWIRENTLRDLTYMDALLDTLSPSDPIKTRATQEVAISTPQTSEEKDKICTDVSDRKRTYWPSLEGTAHDRCQDESLVAFADYTKNDTTMYFKENGIAKPTDVPPEVKYGGKYTITSEQLSKIQGRLITYIFPNGKTQSNAAQYLFYGIAGNIKYQRYLNLNLIEESPEPSSTIADWNNIFPDTQTFYIGYIQPGLSPIQITQSSFRIELR